MRNLQGLLKKAAGRSAREGRRSNLRTEDPFVADPTNPQQRAVVYWQWAQNEGPGELPEGWQEVRDSPSCPVDYTILYKGLTKLRLQAWFTTGIIDMNDIISNIGGDFNGTEEALYFAGDHQTAEHYRKLAADVHPMEQTCVVQIFVPKQYFRDHNTLEANFDSNFRQYVWTCRNKKGLSADREPIPSDAHRRHNYFPESVRAWAARAIIRGPIVRVQTERLSFPFEEIEEKFTEDLLAREHGNKRSQQVCIQNFRGAGRSVAFIAFDDLAKHNLHIQVYRALQGRSSGGR